MSWKKAGKPIAMKSRVSCRFLPTPMVSTSSSQLSFLDDNALTIGLRRTLKHWCLGKDKPSTKMDDGRRKRKRRRDII